MKHLHKIVDNRFGMLDIIGKIPAYKGAAAFLDAKIDSGLSAPLVSPGCLELGAVELAEQAQADGIDLHAVQLVLNCLRSDAYTFGAREGDRALGYFEAVGRLVKAARASIGLGTHDKSQDCIPVHRFYTAALGA